jgi:hypothetical protein
MTMQDITAQLGIARLRKVSETTTVIEMTNGYVKPATQLEIRMWELLRRVSV